MARTPTKSASAPRRRRALVIDDAEQIRDYLVNLLELKGFDVDTASDGRRGQQLLESGAAPDVVLLDVMMPGQDGIQTVRNMRQHDATVPIVMLSVVGTAATIVEAMQAGATDYINKPFDDEELEATLAKVIQRTDLRERRKSSREVTGEDASTAVWKSTAMRQIRQVIDQIGDTDVTVLIQGESGVGKEIVARAIHTASTRNDGPFVKVNCAALPKTFSRASCSVMRRERSPGPTAESQVASNSRTAARCSSTRSAR